MPPDRIVAPPVRSGMPPAPSDVTREPPKIREEPQKKAPWLSGGCAVDRLVLPPHNAPDVVGVAQNNAHNFL